MNARVDYIRTMGIGALIWLLAACQSEQPIPKPIGYFRIEVPDYTYLKKTPDCPFTFEISSLSRIEYFDKPEEDCWFDIYYPNFKARVHMTYKKLDKDLAGHLEHARAMAYEHQIKANSIQSTVVNRADSKVYGLTYKLGGQVASAYQFYLTDSLNHFLRGSLYFEARPNPDSIQPALTIIQDDMSHFIENFEWSTINKSVD